MAIDTDPKPGRFAFLLFLGEPIVVLLVVIALSALLKRVSLEAEQGFLILAAFLLPFVAVVWLLKAHRSVSATAKSLSLFADAALWFGITYLAIELDVVTKGVHQPGGPLLLVFPVGTLLIGALVYMVRSLRASNPRMEAGAATPSEGDASETE